MVSASLRTLTRNPAFLRNFASSTRKTADLWHQCGAPSRLAALLRGVADETDAWAQSIEKQAENNGADVLPFRKETP